MGCATDLGAMTGEIPKRGRASLLLLFAPSAVEDDDGYEAEDEEHGHHREHEYEFEGSRVVHGGHSTP